MSEATPKLKLSRLVGHNVLNFDIPYLIRWSIYNGVKVPQECTPFGGRGNGRYLPAMYSTPYGSWVQVITSS